MKFFCLKKKDILLILGFLAIFQNCSPKKDIEEIEISGKAMGSVFSVKYLDNGKKNQASEIADYLKKYFINFQNITSLYQNDSELIRINKTIAGKKIKISRELGVMLEYALDLSDKTNGAYDVTAGSISKLWSTEELSNLKKKDPDKYQINNARFQSGFRKILLEKNTEGFFLEKKINGIVLDFASLSAGYAADEISVYLEKNKIKNYLINISGEFRASTEGKKKWIVGIENPTTHGEIISKINLENFSMATSGNYRNVNNIVNPIKGKPVKSNLLSVSVISDSCMKADALATALYVLGLEKAIEYSRNNNLAIFLIFLDEENNLKTYYSGFLKNIIIDSR